MRKKKFRDLFFLTQNNIMGNAFSRSSNDQSKGNKRALDPEETQGRQKKARFDNEPAVIIKESEVGIGAFVNPALKGFHSILKYR